MGQISLKGMEFFAFHGVYEEERVKGNKFEVDLTINYPFEDKVDDDQLENTIDYAELYELVKAVMDKPANLLEHLAVSIGNAITRDFPQIEKTTITVTKFNPPINGRCEKAEVTVSL